MKVPAMPKTQRAVGVSQRASPLSEELPLELWTMIIEELQRSLKRNDLLPLLSVSRQMYNLIVPFFYQSITLDGMYMMTVPEPTTYANPHCLESLCVSLRNPSLSHHTTTLIEWLWGTGESVDALCGCLRELKNLQRLYLFTSVENSLSSVYTSVPRCAPLTHLSVNIAYRCAPLHSLLEAHSSTLRSLRVEVQVLDTDQNLFLSAMPSLHTFEGPSYLWADIIKVAPIKHLSVFEVLDNVADALEDDQDLFDNLTSLRAPLCELDTAGPLLRSIRALHLCINERDPTEINIRPLMNIPSKHLKYMNFSRSEFLDGFNHTVETLFHQHPSLAVIEFTKGELDAEGEAYRYHRLDENQPEQICRRATGLFEPWFERMGEDFGIPCREEN